MAIAVAPEPQVERVPEYPRLAPGMMGMYIFLASEVMFFGTMFAGYFYIFGSHITWPPAGSHPVNWFPIPMVNTVVLLSSGVTMHVAHLAIQAGDRGKFIRWLVLTIVLGFLFEVGQAYEFLEKLAPSWIGVDPAGAMGFTANPFASAFFTMTGFHGLHVLGGLVILMIILARATRSGQFSAQHHVGVAAGAIYWHFVDVVWIALFGVLYLAVTYGT